MNTNNDNQNSEQIPEEINADQPPIQENGFEQSQQEDDVIDEANLSEASVADDDENLINVNSKPPMRKPIRRMKSVRMNSEPPSAYNRHSVSLYSSSHDAMDEFPVLKAFQQYIDAEQAKARKRLIAISIIFSALTVILIGAFMIILKDTNARADDLTVRNQQLNDRLVDFAMKERENTAKNLANEATVKAMTETIATLQKQLAAQQEAVSIKESESESLRAEVARQLAEMERSKAKEAELAEAQQRSAAVAAEIAQQKKVAEEMLKKIQAELAASQKRLAEEQEKLKQQQIERYRREHYPKFYAQKAKGSSEASRKSSAPNGRVVVNKYAVDSENNSQATPKPTASNGKQTSSSAGLDELDLIPRSYFSETTEKPAKEAEKKKASESGNAEDDDLKPIEYFKDGKFDIPINPKVKQSGSWSIPLD